MSDAGSHTFAQCDTEVIDANHSVVTATCSKCGFVKTLDVDARGALLDPDQPNVMKGCPK